MSRCFDVRCVLSLLVIAATGWCGGAGAELQNVAFRSDADATSVYNASWPVSGAVDEVTGDNGYHTGSTTGDQYWWTDLGMLVPIRSVKIVARTGFVARINNCEVEVYDSDDIDLTGAVPLFRKRITIRTGVEQTFVMPAGLKGRSIKVHRVSGTDHINLSEIYVYSDNLALGRPAEMSTTYSASYPAWRAVDGARNKASADIAASQLEAASYPWWQVDLQRVCVFEGILLYNRLDATWDVRLADLNFQILAEDGATVLYDHKVATGGLINPGDVLGRPAVIPIDMSTTNVQGRYLKVIRETNADILQLSEVEVYGAPLVENRGVTDLSSTSATLNGFVGGTNTNTSVTVYWGSEDAGTNWSAWANETVIGQTAAGTGVVSLAISGLTVDTPYYYCFRASNSAGEGWDDSDSFRTIPVSDGLVFWVNANSLDQSDGTPVAALPDLSSNSYDMVQGTAGAQPTYVTDAFGGRPAISFDGNDTLLSGDMQNGWPSNSATVFFVTKADATSSDRIFRAEPDNNSDRFLSHYAYSNGNTYFDLGNDQPATGRIYWPNYHPTDPGMWCYWAENGVGKKAFRNGVLIQSSANSATFSVNGYKFMLGYLYPGDIAEMIIYNRPLNAEERNAVGKYLADKYSIGATYYDADANVPASISGLKLWLDADNLAELTDGSGVDKWGDRSGNANDAAQGTAGDQPRYTTNALNGKPVLRFDGAGDYMLGPSASFDTRTIVAVCKVASDATSLAGLLNQQTDADTRNIRADGGTWRAPRNPSYTANTGDYCYGGKVFVNGLAGFRHNSEYHILLEEASATSTFAYQLGQRAYSRYFKGDVAEVLIYDRVLTFEERNALGTYLEQKWGLDTAYDTNAVPLSVDGLAWWVKAEDLDLTDGQAVPTWGSCAEGYYVGIQEETGGQPTYVANSVFNNRPAVSFDGGVHFDYGTMDATFPTTDITVFIVAKADSSSQNSQFLQTNSGGAERFGLHLPWSSGACYFDFGDTSTSSGRASWTDTTVVNKHIYVMRSEQGVGQQVYRDGGRIYNDGNAGDFIPGSQTLDFGRDYQGDVAEVIIYNRALTAEERNTVGIYLAEKYDIPSAYYDPNSGPGSVSGLALWLDAETLSQSYADGGDVTTWYDRSANANNAASASAGSGLFRANVVNGRPVIRFDGADAHYFNFSRISNIRTVFWVVAENAAATGQRFLLGDDTYYDFHRSGTVGPGGDEYLWNTSHGYRWRQPSGGATYLNGQYVDGGYTQMPTTHSIIAATSVNDARANRLSRDRTQGGRNWYGDVAEVLVYNRELTIQEMNTVGAYLSEKYAIATDYEEAVVTPTDFAHKLRITFDGYTESAVLTNFPVLVKLSEAIDGFAYKDFANEDGSDLRFTADGSTNALNFDVESWDTNGTSYVWVRLPELRTDTVIWARWGNSALTQLPNYAVNGGTWDDGYVGVWHLSADAADASRYGSTGSGAGTADAAGKIGNGEEFFGGQTVNCGTSEMLDAPGTLTVEAWGKADTVSGSRAYCGKDSNFSWRNGGDELYLTTPGHADHATTAANVLAGQWCYAVCTFQNSAANGCKMYKDGALSREVNASVRDNPTTTSFKIGNNHWNNQYFDGVLDEIRISSVIRPADWIKASYQTVQDVATFADYDGMIVNDEPLVAKTSATLNGTLNFTDGLATTVKVLWGTTDGGDAFGGWDNTNTVGTYSAAGAVAYAASGLPGGQRYYYRFYATNASGEAWATVPAVFITRPSDAAGMALWLAADAINQAEGTDVATWHDLSGNGNNAAAHSASSGTFTTNADGNAVVRFDGVDGHYYDFTRITNIRTVFWVVAEDASSTTERFLLGDGSTYDFHRGNDDGSGRRYIWSTGNAPLMVNGHTYLNGAEIDGRTTRMPTNCSVIAVTTSGDARADRLVDDRGISSRSWFGDIAEVIVYNRELTAGEINEIGGYLAAKYGIATTYEDDVIVPGAFARKRRIQVTGYAGGETLANFPVLVKFDQGGVVDYADFAADGGGLRFALDGSPYALNFDIDQWDTNGTSYVWVTIPALTNGTTFWAYWGNPSVTNVPYYAANGGAWAADYAGVWHMGEIDARDATPHHNHGTAGGSVGVTLNHDSRIGRGIDLPGGTTTGGFGYVHVPDNYSLKPGGTFTVSGWITWDYDSNTSWGRLISKKNAYNDAAGFELNHHYNYDQNISVSGAGGSSVQLGFTESWRAGQWDFITVVYNGATVSVYANGALKNTGTITAVTDSGVQLTFGNDNDNSEWNWDGKLDEMRLADAVRSADWIKAEYDTVADTDFLTIDDMVTVRDASNLATTSARLNGDLAWTGGLSTEVKVVYGTSDAGATLTGWGATATVATVSAPQALAADVSGLTPSTVYYYRFFASNSGGDAWSDAAGTFRTRFADVDGLALWWDAGAIAGATNNGAVASWTDWSGNGNDGGQAQADRRPTYRAAGLNGQPVVRLDGANDGLYYDGGALANTDYTIIIVEGRRSAKDNNYILIGSTASANQNLHYGYRLNAQFTQAHYANDYNMAIDGFGTQEFVVWASTLNSAESQGRRTYRNGVYLGGDANLGKLTSYRGATLGTWPNQGRYYDGDIAEYIVFDRALEPAELNEVGAYLSRKYGLQTPYEADVDTTDYAHSLDISFDNYAGTEVLTNFPVLVKLAETIPNFLYSQFSSANGHDLRFTMQGATNLLNYEIEDWDTGGTSFVWVRIPAFTNHTTITAYWGNPSAPDVEPFYAAAGGVWDDTFRGVWHLAETNFPYADSTWNLRNGTTGTLPVYTADGLVGPCPDFGGATPQHRIDIPYTAALNMSPYSVSFWARVDGSQGAYRSPVTSRRGGPPQQGYISYALNNNTWSFWQGTGSGWATVGGPAVTVGQVAHITMTYDGTQTRQYFNGSAYGPTPAALQANNAYPLRIGAGGTEGTPGNYFFDGPVDEVRVSRVVRSQDWHNAELANVSDYANFTTRGDVVGPLPYIRNLAPTLVIDTNGTANGYVATTGEVATTVWLYWGDAYHETSGWENTNALGVKGDGSMAVTLTNLAKTTTYYYRFFASNVFGTAWAEPTTNFTTLDTYYIVTPGSGPNGTIDPSLVQYVSEGTDSAVFTFHPDYGYHLTNVWVDTGLIGVTNQYQFLNVFEGHSITSYYGINYYDLSVVQGAGGSIAPASPSPVMHGTDGPVFSITPDAGYYLTDVRVDGVSRGLLSSYQFTNVQTNHTITAMFEAYPDTFPRADVAFWIQADDLPYTNTERVAEWYEVSHTNNLIQPNMGYRPQYVTNGINGHAAVRFTGLESMTNLAMNADWPTDNATIFIVARASTLSQNSHIFRSEPFLSNPRFSSHLPWSNGNDYLDYGDQGNGRLYWGNAGTDQDSIWCLQNAAGVSQSAWRNGALKKSEATTGTWDPTGYSFSVGATYQGDIAELIVFNTALDALDRNRVGYYLQQKYGIATDYVDPRSADLGLSLAQTITGRSSDTPDGVSAVQGETVDYTISVTNMGPTNVTGLVVTDLIPAGLTYQSHSGGTYDDGSGQWTVGNLAAQAGTTLVVTVTVDAGVGYRAFTNTAAITAVTETERESGNNSATQVLRTWHDALARADYQNRVKITFPGYDRAGVTLTNFPALVTLNSSIPGFSYAGFESAIGADLRFTDADGETLIPHEIEKWNAAGDSLVWVRLPTLSVGTYIWAYWGNAASAESTTAPTDVTGCVLWLKADAGVQASGGAVTSWQDQSGNGHDVSQATPSSQPTFVSSVSALNGKPVVRFTDAADDGVGFDGVDLGIGATDDRTVVMVVTPDSGFTQGSEVIGQDTGHMLDFGSYTYTHRLRLRNDTVNLYSGQQDYSVRYDLPHILVVRSSNGATVVDAWREGERIVSGEASTAFQWAMNSLHVGLSGNADRSFEGDLAELMVYSRDLSEEEINALGLYLAAKYRVHSSYALPAYARNGNVWTESYKGVWHLADSSYLGSAPTDAFGFANDPARTTGKIGDGQTFGGYDEIRLWNNCSIDGTESLTFSTWIKTSLLSNQILFQQRDLDRAWNGNNGWNGEWQVVVNGSGYPRFWIYYNGTGFDFTGSSLVTDGTWHQVTAVREGGEGRLYVDGQFAGSQSAAVKSLRGVIQCSFGRDIRDGGSPVNGAMDEGRLANTARSTNWIWAAYQNMASNATFVGYEDVTGKPVIENLGATYVRREEARFNGTLTSTGGLETAVAVYWDTADHGTDKSAWGHTNTFAGYRAAGAVYTNIYTLTPGTTYYYAFYASNSYGEAWATPTATNFQTAAANEFAISAVAGSGGSIVPAGVEFVTLGNDSSTYTFPAVTGHELTNVLVDSVSVGTPANHQFTAVDDDHTIEALFGIKHYTIAVTQSAGGTITPDPAATVAHGADSQAFTIDPAAGYYLANLVVDGANVGQVFSYQFTGVTNNHAISATFAALPTLPGSGDIAFWVAADTLAATNGQSVAFWQDLSGNDRHAEQTTEDDQPTLVTGLANLNGKPAVRFDGAGDCLPFDGTFLAGTDYTIIVVEGRRSNKSSNYILRGDAFVANNNLHLGYRDNGTLTLDHYATTFNVGVIGYSAQQFKAQMYWLKSGTGRRIYMDGALLGSNASATYLASNPGQAIASADGLFEGDIAEMIIYTRALDDGERRDVWQYLSSKYALDGLPTALLPVGVDDPQLWVSAADLHGYSDGDPVAAWPDLSGRGRNMSNASGKALYKENMLNGLPAVRFTGDNDDYFSFSAMTDIRTVFWVVREVENPTGDSRFLLGYYGANYYDFHRASPGGNIWNSSHAPLCFNGTTKLRGFEINGRTTDMPTDFAILSVRTSGNARANSFSNDRNIAGRTWQGDLAELIIYNRVLSETEEREVGEFLMDKYRMRTSMFILR